MSQYPPPPPFSPQPGLPAGASPPRSTTSGAAVTSLIFGLLLCIPLLAGILAVICGAIGIKRTKDPLVGGRGMATAGLILGLVNLLFAAYLLATWAQTYPVIKQWWQGIATQREDARAFLKELADGDLASAQQRCGPDINRAGLARLQAVAAPGGKFKDATFTSFNDNYKDGLHVLSFAGTLELQNGTKTFEIEYQKVNGQWKITYVHLK